MSSTQESARLWGKYRCQKCGRWWYSGNSWANTGQQCKECKTMVYPIKQSPLDKPSGMNQSNPNRDHERALCGQCQKLGYDCSKDWGK